MPARSAHQAAALVLLLTLLPAGPGARAQSPPRREEISEELSALVRDRWETIKREASDPAGGEWAGSYRALGGPTISTHLAWAPRSGFMVWWDNCSRPWTARVNYGGAALAGGALRLTPELPAGSPSAYAVGPELVPVKWGAQHFLIPSDEMINFAYAANSGSAEQVESFFMKVDDYEKEREGLPDVPREYRKHLGMRPIRAAVSGLGPEEEGGGRPPKVILNAGRAEGVVRGMRFYLSRPKNLYVQLWVTGVGEHTSEASVIMVAFKDGREGEAGPKVGWRFTSRAPADDSRYAP